MKCEKHTVFEIDCIINDCPYMYITTRVVAVDYESAKEAVCRRLATRFGLKFDEIKIFSVQEFVYETRHF